MYRQLAKDISLLPINLGVWNSFLDVNFDVKIIIKFKENVFEILENLRMLAKMENHYLKVKVIRSAKGEFQLIFCLSSNNRITNYGNVIN